MEKRMKTLVRIDPFADFRRIFETPELQGPRLLPVNAWSDEMGLTLQAFVPGLSEDQVSLTVEEGNLKISVQPATIGIPENARLHRHEILSVASSRTLRLPEDIDVASATASLSNGVLSVRLNRRVDAEPRVRSIPVSRIVDSQ